MFSNPVSWARDFCQVKNKDYKLFKKIWNTYFSWKTDGQERTALDKTPVEGRIGVNSLILRLVTITVFLNRNISMSSYEQFTLRWRYKNISTSFFSSSHWDNNRKRVNWWELMMNNKWFTNGIAMKEFIELMNEMTEMRWIAFLWIILCLNF